MRKLKAESISFGPEKQLKNLVIKSLGLIL